MSPTRSWPTVMEHGQQRVLPLAHDWNERAALAGGRRGERPGLYVRNRGLQGLHQAPFHQSEDAQAARRPGQMTESYAASAGAPTARVEFRLSPRCAACAW